MVATRNPGRLDPQHAAGEKTRQIAHDSRGTAGWTALSAASALLTIGTVAFVGWALWVTSGRYGPGRLPLLPSSGICFLAMGAGLLALVTGTVPRHRREVQLIGLSTATFGILALLEVTNQASIHVSEVFLLGRGDPILMRLLRMSPTAALDFVLAGLALALVAARWSSRLRPLLVHSLGAVPLATGFVVLLDRGLYRLHLVPVPSYEALPPLTAWGFLIFGIALAATLEFLTPQAAFVFSEGLRGRLVRRVVPATLVVLMGSTIVGLVAINRGWIGTLKAMLLLLGVNGVSLSGLLALSASHLVKALHIVRAQLENLQSQRPSRETYDASSASLRAAGFEFQGVTRLLTAFAAQHQALQREVAERERTEIALREALERAEAAARAKAEFLSSVSHEIRTPMTGILGTTELALSTPLSAEQREYITLAHESAGVLLRLVNDILDLSKIEADKLVLAPEPFAVAELVADTLRTLSVRAEQKGLDLACRVAPQVPSIVVGDAARLRQILFNLVGNAIKFTERGEILVDVALDTDAESELLLRFAVRDTGIGIPASEQERIFEPFVSSPDRRQEGTGLGLAITARLAALMGGRIWVESDPGLGSTFFVTARFGRSPGQRSLEPAAILADRWVLAIDPSPTRRRILEEVLRAGGLRVMLAGSAPEAFEKLETHRSKEPIALVLLDATVPEADRVMLVKTVQHACGLDVAIFLIVPAAAPALERLYRQHVDAAGFVTRPLKPQELLLALRSALSRDQVKDVISPAPAPSALRPERRRVLLAEDNPVNQLIARRILEKRGHDVVVVGNGAEALAALETGSFDVVLMDIQMPVMDGLAATEWIRAREHETSAPHQWIVALTAHAMPGYGERCLRSGMDAYVTKPIQVQDLVAAVEQDVHKSV